MTLKPITTISLLITDFKQNTTYIRDLSFARNEFYVLLTYTEYPIQSFSKQGSLIRCILSRDVLTDDVWHFCLDQQLNILVADNGSSRVKIFSNEGKLMTQIEKKGIAKGEFTELTGIAVNELCSIITVDRKEHNMLQAFSYVDLNNNNNNNTTTIYNFFLVMTPRKNTLELYRSLNHLNIVVTL